MNHVAAAWRTALFWGCLGGILAVAGCATAPGPQIAMKPEDQRTAEKTIASSLKVPDEAQFRNFRAFSTREGTLFCGEVTSRNSFGGYAGFVRFFQIWKFDGQGYFPQPPVMERSPDGKLASAWGRAHPDCD